MSTCALLSLTACEPPTRAVVGVERSATGITAAVLVCDDQPVMTLRVYTGANGSFTAVGKLRRNRVIQVPLTGPSPGWRTGQVTRFQPGRTYEVDTEGGDGSRLGAAVYFTVQDVPSNGVLTEAPDGGPNQVVSLATFTERARSTC